MLLILFQISGIFVLPIILIAYGIVKPRQRLLALLFVTCAVLAITAWQRWSLTSLGIRHDNFYLAILPYFFLTIAGTLTILIAAKLLRRKPYTTWKSDPHFLFLFLPISIAQEFLYRGFLMPQLHTLWSSPLFIIVVNTLLFAFLHSIYPNRFVNTIIALLAGSAFATVYYYYPNLILISLCHAALNFTAVYFGFFTATD